MVVRRSRGCRGWAALAAVVFAGFGAAARADSDAPVSPSRAAMGTATSDTPSPNSPFHPLRLSMMEDGVETAYPPTIYAPITAPRPEDGVNAGGVNLSLTVNYLTDYVYRGIDHSEVGGSEDAPNLQFDGKLSFNLGRLPHPFIGLFVNVYNDDPISRFQEVRPYFGFDWNLKPFTISAGTIFYIFPEREKQNTSEVFTQITFDDSLLFRTERPVLSPYIYGAYDYDKYDGYYLELGVKHDFPIQDTGVTLTAVADMAYVMNNAQFTGNGHTDDGFQHYDVGLIGSYSLNTVLNLPRRYGQWSVKGYLYYTDGLSAKLRADTQIWGGVGINFEY